MVITCSFSFVCIGLMFISPSKIIGLSICPLTCLKCGHARFGLVFFFFFSISLFSHSPDKVQILEYLLRIICNSLFVYFILFLA